MSFFELQETDMGSKGRAKSAAERFPDAISADAKWRIRVWWQKVKETARALCPVDYGILQATVRIEEASPFELGQAVGMENFEVQVVPEKHKLIQHKIIAGGMLMHPKTGRIVDYAAAVHDGHFTVSGRWIPPNPFITTAINIHIGELYRILDQSVDNAINTVWVGS